MGGEVLLERRRFARSVSVDVRCRGRAMGGRRAYTSRHRSARAGREGRLCRQLHHKVSCGAGSSAHDGDTQAEQSNQQGSQELEEQQLHLQQQHQQLQQQQHQQLQQQLQLQHQQQQLLYHHHQQQHHYRQQHQHHQPRLPRRPLPPSPHQQPSLRRSPLSSPTARHPLPASPWTPLLEAGRVEPPIERSLGRPRELPVFQDFQGSCTTPGEAGAGVGLNEDEHEHEFREQFGGFVPFAQQQHQQPRRQQLQVFQHFPTVQALSGRQPPASPPALRTPQVRGPMSSPPSTWVAGTPTLTPAPAPPSNAGAGASAAAHHPQYQCQCQCQTLQMAAATPSGPRLPLGSPLLALTTPEPRPILTAPPLAPNQLRDRLELEEDIATALEWQSEPLLTMTLLRQHNSKCTKSHALHEAITLQHLGAVTFLLEFGPDLEEVCHNCRPLVRAVRNSSSDGDTGHRIVQLLLDRGASVDAPSMDASGDTVAHHAAAHCHQGLLLTLLKSRADPNALNSRNRTPLHLACSPHAPQLGRSEVAIVDLLLRFGADPRLEDSNGLRPCDLLVPRFPNKIVASHPSWVLLAKAANWLNRSPAVLMRAHRRTDFLAGVPMWYDLPEMIFRTVILFL